MATEMLKPGDKLRGDLTVVRKIGQGFTGVVVEAHNPFTQQSYAAKIMHEPSEHQLSRLSAEARMLIRLEHQNLVRVHDAGALPDGRGWLLMELLRGQTLGDLLARQGRLSPLLAIRYALGIAWGVAATHEHGVIHRDLKPDNVFIVEGENIPKVLDFSGAKYRNADLRTTKPPDMTGTVAFMSPEQIDGETADGRIDVYALGLIFDNMLRGEHAFEQHLGNLIRLATAQAVEKVRPIAGELGLPGIFDTIIQKATAKELDHRYPTVKAFAQAVLDARRELCAEVEAGRIQLEKRPGEPSLDDRDSRSEYQAPRAVLRPDTGPFPPEERVSVAPAALSVPAPPPETREQPARRGPTGTVRLSEVIGLAAEARRAGASAARATPPSQVATERVRKRSPEASAGRDASAPPRASTPQPTSAPAESRVAARSGGGRRRAWLLPVLAAALVGSAGVAFLRRTFRVGVEIAVATSSAAPTSVALVPDPLPVERMAPIPPAAPSVVTTAAPSPSSVRSAPAASVPASSLPAASVAAVSVPASSGPRAAPAATPKPAVARKVAPQPAAAPTVEPPAAKPAPAKPVSHRVFGSDD